MGENKLIDKINRIYNNYKNADLEMGISYNTFDIYGYDSLMAQNPSKIIDLIKRDNNIWEKIKFILDFEITNDIWPSVYNSLWTETSSNKFLEFLNQEIGIIEKHITEREIRFAIDRKNFKVLELLPINKKAYGMYCFIQYADSPSVRRKMMQVLFKDVFGEETVKFIEKCSKKIVSLKGISNEDKIKVLVNLVKHTVAYKDLEMFLKFFEFSLNTFTQDKQKNNKITKGIKLVNQYPFLIDENFEEGVISNEDKVKLQYLQALPKLKGINSFKDISNRTLAELNDLELDPESGIKINADSPTNFDIYSIFNSKNEIVIIDSKGKIQYLDAERGHEESLEKFYESRFEITKSDTISSLIYKGNLKCKDILLLTEGTALLAYFPQKINKSQLEMLKQTLTGIKQKEQDISLGMAIQEPKKQEDYIFLENNLNIESIILIAQEKILAKTKERARE